MCQQVDLKKEPLRPILETVEAIKQITLDNTQILVDGIVSYVRRSSRQIILSSVDVKKDNIEIYLIDHWNSVLRPAKGIEWIEQDGNMICRMTRNYPSLEDIMRSLAHNWRYRPFTGRNETNVEKALLRNLQHPEFIETLTRECMTVFSEEFKGHPLTFSISTDKRATISVSFVKE